MSEGDLRSHVGERIESAFIGGVGFVGRMVRTFWVAITSPSLLLSTPATS